MQDDPVILSERCNEAQYVKMRKVDSFGNDKAIVVTALNQVDLLLVVHHIH